MMDETPRRNETQSRLEMLNVEEIESEVEFVPNTTSLISRSNNSHMEHPYEDRGILRLDFGTRSAPRGQFFSEESPCSGLIGNGNKTGKWVEVTRWTFQREKVEKDGLLNRVSSIERESCCLTKLEHVNLVQHLGFKHDLMGDNVVIYFLNEFVSGPSCNALFTGRNLSIDGDFLRHLAKGVLGALDYLHRNDTHHKSLKDTCVFIDKKGTIKVSDYSLQKALLDVIHSTRGDYNKKTDIYDFGMLVLRLLGYSVLPERQIFSQLSKDLFDFLSRCLNEDEEERHTAYQLLNHSFFHERLDQFCPRHHPIPSQEIGSLSLSKSRDGQSRFKNDFEILENLGKGAYGKVSKVKHKLDGGFYAIKRIRLSPDKRSLNKEKEVKLLSKLNHENVVRYYHSWVETSNGHFVESSEEESSSSNKKTTYSLGNSDPKSDSIEFKDESSKEHEVPHNPITSDCYKGIACQEQYLYMQMEYCGKGTLRGAINDNLCRQIYRRTRLFKEMVNGLEYVHSKGIIHRDLKPTNVFLNSSDHIKIGDFGLATRNKSSRILLQANGFRGVTRRETVYDECNTKQIGTSVYVAPEMDALGTPYDEKVDIYSLGIIFFEMIYPPRATAMEMSRILENLRCEKIIFPDDLTNNEELVKFIKSMLNHDVSRRLTAQELKNLVQRSRNFQSRRRRIAVT